MLSARGLGIRRGGRVVISGLDFELQPGQALELRGANGSGKTSLLRVLAGLAPLSDGQLLWHGEPLREQAGRTAYLGHQNALSADLSPGENLDFLRRLGGDSEALDAPSALQAWGLADVAEQQVRSLSQGQRRRLALARICLAQRTLWLLDEPCTALDSAAEAVFAGFLSTHLAAGGMAIVATHQPLTVAASALQCVDLDRLAMAC